MKKLKNCFYKKVYMENDVKNVDYSFFRLRFFSHIGSRIYRADTQSFEMVERFKKSYGDNNIEIIPATDKGDIVKKVVDK